MKEKEGESLRGLKKRCLHERDCCWHRGRVKRQQDREMDGMFVGRECEI